ncbi:MAG: sulfatase-like hydrolase/transferase, partial [Haloarculaceae archaeon]
MSADADGADDLSVLFVSIDSLSRHFLDVYPEIDVEFDVETDNLDRFAERAAVFDTHYAGSLPCMPARREWLTGTQEFLWRPWGPVEPFDRTLPELARHEGILTQFVTDHYHYFQHGSHGYYEDFNGFEFVRGHEFDAWQTTPRAPDETLLAQVTMGGDAPDAHQSAPDPEDLGFMNRAQYARNVDGFTEESDFFAPKVFDATAEWVRDSQEWDQWFCYVDSFDVHEPFHVPEPYASMYTDEDPEDPDLVNWPYYGRVDRGQSELTDRQLDFVRAQFAGKITMVDRWFGHVLDALDETGAWADTMVVVTADHGHYLGEHGWVGKPQAPMYDVLTHTPLFVHHPDAARAGERIGALTSAVDLYGTVLDELGVDADHRHSRSLSPLLHGERDSHRDWAIYGYWGSSVNVTDGEYTYLRPCDESVDAECYSTEMMNALGWFQPREPEYDAEAGDFLPYTESPVWRWETYATGRHDDPMLFDVTDDPEQERDLAGADGPEEDRMRALLVEAM